MELHDEDERNFHDDYRRKQVRIKPPQPIQPQPA